MSISKTVVQIASDYVSIASRLANMSPVGDDELSLLARKLAKYRSTGSTSGVWYNVCGYYAQRMTDICLIYDDNYLNPHSQERHDDDRLNNINFCKGLLNPFGEFVSVFNVENDMVDLFFAIKNGEKLTEMQSVLMGCVNKAVNDYRRLLQWVNKFDNHKIRYDIYDEGRRLGVQLNDTIYKMLGSADYPEMDSRKNIIEGVLV